MVVLNPADKIALGKHAPRVRAEIVERRGPQHKVFSLGRRKRALILSQTPIHYWDQESKSWLELDFRPRETPQGLEISLLQGKVVVPDRPSVPEISVGPLRMTLHQLPGRRIQRPEVVVSPEGFIQWRGFADDCWMWLQPMPGGIRLWRILETPDAPHEWVWRVSREEETPRLKPRSSGRDADGDRLETESELEERGSFVLFTERATGRASKVTDESTRIRSWAPATYPLRIDPTVTYNVAAGRHDARGTYRQSRTFTTASWGFTSNLAKDYSTARLGRQFASGAPSQRYRWGPGAAWEIGDGTNTLPANARIDSATLSIWQLSDVSNSNCPVKIGGETWAPATTTATTPEPWKFNATTGTVTPWPWGQISPGTHTKSTNCQAGANTTISFDVKTVVQKILNGTSGGMPVETLTATFNDWIRMVIAATAWAPTTSAVADFVTVAMDDHSQGFGPRLKIVYTEDAGGGGDAGSLRPPSSRRTRMDFRHGTYMRM